MDGLGSTARGWYAEVGEREVVIGSPRLLELTVSDGIVSAIRTDTHAGQAIQLQPQNHVFLFNLGMLMSAANSYDNAASAFQKAIRVKPENADCHYMLAKTYAQQGNIPASLREYNLLQKLEPGLAQEFYRYLKL